MLFILLRARKDQVTVVSSLISGFIGIFYCFLYIFPDNHRKYHCNYEVNKIDFSEFFGTEVTLFDMNLSGIFKLFFN